MLESPLPADRPEHIVDILIKERAPQLAGSLVWPLLRPLLYAILGYSKARSMTDAIAPLPGRQAMEFVSRLLAIDVDCRGLERLPAAGRVVIVANHPTGIADGIAVYDALKARRPDIMFYANSDAHRVCPAFDEVLIPVEWVEAKRSRERTRLTLTMTREALERDAALMIFPAGRLARRNSSGDLVEPEWMSTALSVARKYGAPVLPLHVAGPWSALFHRFDQISPELRDITLFHEMLNKQGQRFELVVGHPIDPAKLDPDPVLATEAVKRFLIDQLAIDPDARFQ